MKGGGETRNFVDMTMNKGDVWADLRYALDELDRLPCHIHDHLTNAPSEGDFLKTFFHGGDPQLAYIMAKARADTRNAHEAIEKGLKAILIDSGVKVRKGHEGHALHLHLQDIRQHNLTAFNDLERCFNSTIQYLESVTTIQHSTNIIDYFRKHGKTKVFVAKRYESIEGRNNEVEPMIDYVYREIIRALLSLIFGWSPKDIGGRIEEAARKAILVESKFAPAWNVEEWLSRGPIRPRLENLENIVENKVLLAAVQRCSWESEDAGVRFWAKTVRRNRINSKRRRKALP